MGLRNIARSAGQDKNHPNKKQEVVDASRYVPSRGLQLNGG